MENTNRDGHKLLFKGEEYRLGQLFAQVKTAPPIEVKLEELNILGIVKLANAREEQPYVACHVPILPEYQEQFVLFYKQEGKFTVLLGHEKVRQAIADGNKVFRGKIISGPALKKCRIEKPVDVAEAIVEKAREPEVTKPFNAPRVSDRRDSFKTDSDRRNTAPRRGLETNRPYADRPPRRAPSPSNNRTGTQGGFRKS